MRAWIPVALVCCGCVTSSAVGDGGLDAGSSSQACAAVAAQTEGLAAYDALLTCLRDGSQPDAAKRGAVSAFTTLVESTTGFPLVGADRVVFFYLSTAEWDVKQEKSSGPDFSATRRLGPIAVAGDFNAWSPTANALSPEAQHVFHASVPMTVGTTRPRYKFVAHDASATAVWFSDPHSRRFDFDENGRLSIVRGGPLRGHLESLGQVHATKLANDRAVTVWVPPGYEQSTANASVLYMHDGQNLFDADQPDSAPFSWEADEAANAEVLAGHATPFLIVGMANTAGRIDEYTPVTDTYNGQTVGGKGDDYADFVVHDVKPLVDHRFRTFTDRAHTGVVGSSLGGVISYHLGLKFPDVFRFVGGMSSTFDWGAGLNNPLLPAQYRALGSLTTRGQVFYLDSGGGPGPSGTCPADGPNDGNDNYCETLWMKDALLAGGATTFPDDPNAFPLTPANIDLEHWVDPGAPHSETSWRVRVFRPMRLFFRP